jgi:hypothetical protein
MDITNVLKDHGIGIGGVNEFKEFKLLRSISIPDRGYFSNDGDFDDNINLTFKIDTSAKKTLLMKMNVLTDTDYTQVNSLSNLRLYSRPRFSKKYFFALIFDYESIKNGYLYVFTKDGTRILKQISLGDIYNYNLQRVLEDPITGEIAVIFRWSGLTFITIFDQNLNIIKQQYTAISDGPIVGQGSFFYNGYIYSSNKNNEIIKYDYKTDKNVKSFRPNVYHFAMISNPSSNNIYSTGDNKIYDLDFNEINKANGYYNFSGTGSMGLVESLPILDGTGILTQEYGFGFEYKLDKNELKARILMETDLLSSTGWFFTNRDTKTLLYMTNYTMYVYVR